MSSASLAYAGRILVLLGGIIMVIAGVLGLLDLTFTVPFRSLLEDLNITGRGFGLVMLILGIVSIIGSKYVNRLEWAIILIILGFGGDRELGGLLVLVGGILGLVSVLIKKT